MKTMEVIEAWPDIYDGGYMHQFQPESTDQIRKQQKQQQIHRV